MADSFAVELVTPELNLYAGPATAVVLRTTIGSLTVLAGRQVPLMRTLTTLERGGER